MAPLASLAGALLVVGLPFVVQWQRATGTEPASFGNVVAAFVVFGLVLALVAGAGVRHWRNMLVSFGLLIASAGSAVVIAARSGTITAEGILTAMLLPVGLLASGVGAAEMNAGLASRVQRTDIRMLLVMITLLVLSAVVAWRFPVVQFLAGARSGEIHPVQGSWLAFVGGVAAAALGAPMWWRSRWHWSMLLIPAALALGYTMQASFGAAVAMLGVCVMISTRT